MMESFTPSTFRPQPFHHIVPPSQNLSRANQCVLHISLLLNLLQGRAPLLWLWLVTMMRLAVVLLGLPLLVVHGQQEQRSQQNGGILLCTAPRGDTNPLFLQVSSSSST